MAPVHAIARLAVVLCAVVLARPAAGAALTLEGLDGDERDAVLSALGIPACIDTRWRARSLARDVEDKIRISRRRHGDYRPTITVAREYADGCFVLRVAVTPGEPVILREVDVRIDGDQGAHTLLDPLLHVSPLQPGSTFLEADWEAVKGSLGSRALDFGYFDAALRVSSVDIYPEVGAADVSLEFEAGPRYAVGALEFVQAGRALNEDLLSRYVVLQPGNPWDSRDLARTRESLLDSGYFSRVSVAADVDRARNAEMPVRIETETVARFEFGLGAGYSTDVGPRFSAEFADRLANRRGHRYELRGVASRHRSDASFGYRLPARDRRSWWAFDLGAGRLEARSSRNEEVTFGARYVTQIDRHWRRTLRVDLSVTSYDVGPDRAQAAMLTPGAVFDYEHTDGHERLPSGLTLQTEFSAGARPLAATTTFGRAVGHLRWGRRIGERTRALLRADAGATLAVDFRQLPPNQRFFAGGDDSIRGFDFEQLGPVDAGQVVGGRYLLVGSAEVERLVRGRWGIAVFTDAGQAFSTLPFDVEFSSGVGLRWFSPLGSVRIDVGVPWSGGKPRLHVGLGRTL